ncbi:MAG: hypothetical protein JXO72_10325 [Vicinamibacteria bacterium]|nr:hypothetical protein [Vicinamibacteria bacterium]
MPISTLDWCIVLVSRTLLVALILGLLRGRRYRYCYTILIYIVTQLATNVLATHFFPFFLTWIGWTIKEIFYAFLRLIIFTEMSILVFRALPRARIRAYAALLATSISIALALIWLGPTKTDYDLGRELTIRIAYITALGLISMAAFISWYRLPLHRIHKSILHGMVWLLLLHIASFFLRDHGFNSGSFFNSFQIIIYIAWIRAAWAPEPALSLEERKVIRYLQPWRSA